MKPLLLRLILPLSISAALAYYLSTRWPMGGLLINLSATFIGIALTVSYVDWMLKVREAEKWHSTDQRVAHRLAVLLNGTVSSIRAGVGMKPDVVDIQVFSAGDFRAAHKEVIRAAQQVISPVLHERVAALDQGGWRSLQFQVANAHNGILAFFTAFQSRLCPDQLSDFLDLQDALAKSMTAYAIFPDLLGVPKDKLPATRTPPEILQAHAIKETAEELQRAISLAVRLSQSTEELC